MEDNEPRVVTIRTVKMRAGHQVYLPDEVLEASETEEGQSFLIRVRGASSSSSRWTWQRRP